VAQNIAGLFSEVVQGVVTSEGAERIKSTLTDAKGWEAYIKDASKALGLLKALARSGEQSSDLAYQILAAPGVVEWLAFDCRCARETLDVIKRLKPDQQVGLLTLGNVVEGLSLGGMEAETLALINSLISAPMPTFKASALWVPTPRE